MSSPTVIDILSDNELPNPNSLLSPNLRCKEVSISGHGEKVKTSNTIPKMLDKKHNYSEGSWCLLDKVLVSVCVFILCFLFFADLDVG